MSRSTFARSALTSLALVLVGLLLGWLMFSGAAGWSARLAPPRALAAPDPSQFRDPANPDAALAVDSCVPYSVGVFNNRIHVECNMSVTPAPAFRFFAMGFSSSAQTARVLSVLEAAHVSGKRLWVGYNPSDLTGALIGCGNIDCRLIESATIQP